MTTSASTSPLPRIQARFDRPIVDLAGDVRFLIVDVEPPEEERAPLAPLDLVLVIDVSGSMAGGKLEAVKTAVALLIERLGPNDRLWLVSFSSDVRVHFTALAMSGAGGDLARAEIAALHTTGMTNLSAGWLTGVTLLENPADPARRRAVVLLSDGQANQGIVDPGELAEIARRTGASGIPTTCIGVGNDYSTQQLGAIAECSGGRFHDAETPEEILEVMLGELVELGSIALQNAELEISPSGAFAPEPLWTTVCERDGLRVTCPIGAVRAGAKRTLVLRIAPVAALEGMMAVFSLRLRWTDPRTGARRELECEPTALRYGDASSCRASDEDVLLTTRLWSARIGRQIADLNEAGRYDEVRLVMAPQADQVAAHAQSVPAAAVVACDLHRLVAEGTRAMHVRDRKNLYVDNYKGMREEPELRRSRGRGPKSQ
ncbi:MAG: VWA domain-containing protein [Planctomycetota bacterium]|nr:VWA domain-containing protein [Planctomycetota bacterium]